MDDALGPTKPTSAESVSETASAPHQPSFLISSDSSVLNHQHRLARVQAKLSGRTSDRAALPGDYEHQVKQLTGERTEFSVVRRRYCNT